MKYNMDERSAFLLFCGLCLAFLIMLVCVVFLIIFAGKMTTGQTTVFEAADESQNGSSAVFIDQSLKMGFMLLWDLPSSYSPKQAKKDGCIVIENEVMTEGKEQWMAFLEQSGKKQDCFVRIACYGTDHTKPLIRDLFWKQGKYILESFQDGAVHREEYPYLNCYATGSSKRDLEYALVNQQDLTYEEWERSIFSGKAYEDGFQFCSVMYLKGEWEQFSEFFE